jgi:hypothetical protein
MMTPLSVDAVPTRPLNPRPVTTVKRSWRGPAIAVGVMIAAAAGLIVRPPDALREFLKVYNVSLPTAFAASQGASHPASRAAAADSVMQSGVAAAPPTIASADSAGHTTTDSAALRLATTDSLSPFGRHGAMHLGALGDSTDASAAPGTQTADQDAREVLMHVAKARDLSRTNMLKGAGMELRTAYEEYRIFLTEHAAAPQTATLRQELQTAMDEGLAACAAVRDSLAGRGGPKVRCQHPAKTGILLDDSDDGASTPPGSSP